MLSAFYTILLLVNITTCTIYNVSPGNTTCHHCHNLQHYLLNTTKYFVSNTQLLFLPGLHHLHTNFIIQNVHNISLIGSTTNGTTPDTVIQCDSSVGIVLNSISNLVIQNIMIRNCSVQSFPFKTAMLISQCSFVALYNLQFDHPFHQFSILGTNIFGNSSLNYIMFHKLKFDYTKVSANKTHHTISISYCNITGNLPNLYRIFIILFQISYTVTIKVSNITTKMAKQSAFLLVHSDSANTPNMVLVSNCYFNDDGNYKILNPIFSLTNLNVHFNNCEFINFHCSGLIETHHGDNTTISHCAFYFNDVNSRLYTRSHNAIITAFSIPDVLIIHCKFYFNQATSVFIPSKLENTLPYGKYVNLIIQNTTFSESIFCKSGILTLYNTNLLLGPAIFNRIYTGYESVIKLTNSTITVYQYVEFSQNLVDCLISYFCKQYECFFIHVADDTVINITNNSVTNFFIADWILPPVYKIYYPPCFFQYCNMKTFDSVKNRSNRIIFNHNKDRGTVKMVGVILESYQHKTYYKIDSELALHFTHCYWLSHVSFNNSMPLYVNKEYVQMINNSKFLTQVIETENSLCYCIGDKQYDCYKNEFGPLYPGQTLTVLFYGVFATLNKEIIVEIDTNQSYFTPCIVYNPKEYVQLIGTGCTEVNYTIAFPTNNWCELFLKVPQKKKMDYSIFYIRQLPCPFGFAKIDGICICHLYLKQFGITDCDINTQSILHPSNSWIFAATRDKFIISLTCPFHYCKLNAFYLNLSTPDLQCQFNRSGLLCGQCQHGLSTVFGSSYCKQCSSLYLTLIIPIGIAGLLLVLLLFLLNLTVADGSINAFIFYVNIISINSTVFFPHQHTVSPAYIFISLVNLDLGIQTCFYNGMDDYAKMWLQLTFPFYLIFLATLLIITSRYSTKIQRLTANRALPVLATLFLLSYTKILRTVSMVLFFYSSITHLPSQHTTQVWSVDANIPLFGVKFAIIFIVCLVLFLILVSFNVILLFTKTLSRFNVINRFKPLLDAYQGPHKIKFYYWTGLQLVIRVVFFGISSLEKNINLTTGIVILSIINSSNAILQPFKCSSKNYQELLLIINLLSVYTFALSAHSDVSVTATNVLVSLVVVHFSLIVIYSAITYTCNGVIKSKLSTAIRMKIHAVRHCIKSRREPQDQFELQDNMHINIPKVTYNYHEYQEPLIGPEYCK